jgi:hypothetical protein
MSLKLTFEQREGLTALPRQLALGEVDQAVKAGLWFAVSKLIDANSVDNGWGTQVAGDYLEAIAQRHFVTVQHRYIDDFSSLTEDIQQDWKAYFLPKATYGDTLGFTEWLIRADQNRTSLGISVERILIETRCAYRLIEKHTIAPVASEEEVTTYKEALSTLSATGQAGARKHLLEAGSYLSQGKFADSVRESIHSVEGQLRNLTGQSKFSKAVAHLATERQLHESFKAALGNLYGYSSDEEGIRHPLLSKGDANVTEQDALFMMGVCSAFITYLGGSRRSTS